MVELLLYKVPLLAVHTLASLRSYLVAIQCIGVQFALAPCNCIALLCAVSSSCHTPQCTTTSFLIAPPIHDSFTIVSMYLLSKQYTFMLNTSLEFILLI